MKLYEIAADYKALQEMDEHEAVTETLELIEGDFQDKANNVLMVLKNWDADVSGLDAEIKRLTDMKKSIQNHQERLKEYLRHNMQETGISKIDCPLFKVSLSAPPKSVNILDVDALPDDVVTVKTTIQPDKREILRLLKLGEHVPGAALSEGKPRLTIK